MTIYDISEKAGVSIATVSRVLNGSNNVSEKTKKKSAGCDQPVRVHSQRIRQGIRSQHHEDHRYHVCRQFGSVPCQSDLLY